MWHAEWTKAYLDNKASLSRWGRPLFPTCTIPLFVALLSATYSIHTFSCNSHLCRRDWEGIKHLITNIHLIRLQRNIMPIYNSLGNCHISCISHLYPAPALSNSIQLPSIGSIGLQLYRHSGCTALKVNWQLIKKEWVVEHQLAIWVPKQAQYHL